jgi:flagellar basal body-associated protein FliL
MKNSKNKRTIILFIILLGLLVLAYRVIFVSNSEDLSVDENAIASQRVETILNEIKDINFDTSVMKDQNFKSLKSIEIPLLSLPVGRVNPFSNVLKSN